MAVAARPKKLPARKGKKSGALPDGVEQFSLDELFAAFSQAREPEVAAARANICDGKIQISYCLP